MKVIRKNNNVLIIHYENESESRYTNFLVGKLKWLFDAEYEQIDSDLPEELFDI